MGVGALPAGIYKCDIDIHGWVATLDVVLKPSAISAGSYAPAVSIMYLDRVTAKSTVNGANFAAATAQTITVPAAGTVKGEPLAVLTFTVPASDTLTFDATSLAEFSGR